MIILLPSKINHIIDPLYSMPIYLPMGDSHALNVTRLAPPSISPSPATMRPLAFATPHVTVTLATSFRGSTLCSPRPFLPACTPLPVRAAAAATAGAAPAMTAATRVDAHVHVWDPAYATHPDHSLPAVAGSFQHLIAAMDAAAVHKALIVQPINYMFDHTYIRAACAAHPTRLFPIGLADTTGTPEHATQSLRALHAAVPSLKGVRVNPTLAKSQPGFDAPAVTAVLDTAADLGLPACLFARPHHLPSLTALLEDNNENTQQQQQRARLNILLDHFAFADSQKAQMEVLDLVRKFPNVYVKTSAWFRVSEKQWPHDDLAPFLRQLIDAVGPQRLIVGSDFPFITEQYDYARAFAVLEEVGLSENERRWVAGESAARLYQLE